MNIHAKFSISIVVLCALSVLTWKIVEPYLHNTAQVNASDSAQLKGTIRIAMDAWVGYYPLCSRQMQKQLRRSGYGLKCINDNADYKSRYRGLKAQDYDFAVGTVDSYVLNGDTVDYPGPIVAVIDESKGGDAIVAWSDTLPNIQALKETATITGAFTPDSPSHHFAKAISSHFDISALKNTSMHRLTDGSEAARKTFLAKQVDFAILWEPDVTKALTQNGVTRLLGTEDTQQLIVDVLIASQSVVKDNPGLITTLLRDYFKTLKYYRNHPEEFIDDIAKEYKLPKNLAQSLLSGVQWATLIENANRWYGVNQSGFSEIAIIDTIESTLDILLDNEDFSRNPFPNEDPYRLINSGFIQQLDSLYTQSGGFTATGSKTSTSPTQFSRLTHNQWDQLEDIGSLKIRKIVFASGTSALTTEGKNQVDALMADLKHYPNFRVEIRGHTSIRGNQDANIALSQERAEAILRYINITYSPDSNRFRAIGKGGTQPLPLKTGENQGSRSWLYRLPRVEIALVREVI